ncbi:MAG: hypothetical protein WBB23_13655 [Desulforhopalus sp.]
MSDNKTDKSGKNICCSRCGVGTSDRDVLGQIGPRRLCIECIARIQAIINACTVTRFSYRKG